MIYLVLSRGMVWLHSW